jgi:Xaa-Pro aminopeptidase
MGYSINPMAAALLSEYIGNHLNNLANEIGKMIINLEDGEQNSEIHIEENIGIRLENDIVIQEKGFIDLMKNIPIEAEEIEELMNSK